MFLFEPTIQSPTRLTIQSTTPLQLFAIGLQNLRYIQPTVSSRFCTHQRFLLRRIATKITRFVSIRIQPIGETMVTIKTPCLLLRATG